MYLFPAAPYSLPYRYAPRPRVLVSRPMNVIFMDDLPTTARIAEAYACLI